MTTPRLLPWCKLMNAASIGASRNVRSASILAAPVDDAGWRRRRARGAGPP